MAKGLTEITCRNAASEGKKILKLGDGDGLYLWVFLNGSKLWRFRYKFHGKPNTLSLGSYPKVSLSDARKETRKLRGQLDDGLDPSSERKKIHIQEKQAVDNGFEFIAREWFGKQKKSWVDTHTSDVIRRLEVNLFPDLGERPINEITAPELLKTLHKMEKRGAIDLAHRVLGVANQVFSYGMATGKCINNPAAALKGALTPHVKKNQPAVKQEKFPDLLQAIDKYHEIGDLQTEIALKVLAHTFVRTKELIEAPKAEFNLDEKVWVIPGERMKMKLDHIVPLTGQVIGYLQQLIRMSGDSEYILPGRNPFKPMSNNTLLFALYRMGYKSIMTGHGFRAVASTILNETGFNPDVIERQLAHTDKNEVRGAYNRALYMKDRRAMMAWWSSYIEALENGKKPVMPDFYAAA